jgi:hypothetical protein
MTVGDRLMRSRRQEQQGMERFGGVRNPRSGARWDRRNDGRTSTELVEFKRTDNRRSITLKYDDLRQLRQHAVVECRTPVLGFELSGEHFVVLAERDYHELAAGGHPDGPAADLRAPAPRLAGRGEVLGKLRQQSGQSVLRRSSAQRSGQRGQVGLLGNPPGPPRPLPGPRPVSRLRAGQRREVGRLGRVLRKGAPQDQAGPPS